MNKQLRFSQSSHHLGKRNHSADNTELQGESSGNSEQILIVISPQRGNRVMVLFYFKQTIMENSSFLIIRSVEFLTVIEFS